MKWLNSPITKTGFIVMLVLWGAVQVAIGTARLWWPAVFGG